MTALCTNQGLRGTSCNVKDRGAGSLDQRSRYLSKVDSGAGSGTLVSGIGVQLLDRAFGRKS